MRLCWLLLPAVLAACAGGPQKGRDFRAETDADVAVLTARGTAHSLATAALLNSLNTAPGRPESQTHNSAQSQVLMKRAVGLNPNEEALAYIEWRECAAGKSPCEEGPRIAGHLQAVAPDNGLVWLTDLDAARESGDESTTTRIISKIGASRRIAIYWNALVVMVTDELAATQEDPITRMLRAIIVVSAVAVPPLQSMSTPCRRDQFDRPGRREACEAMTARMAESDSILMQGFGLSIQEKWWPDGSVQREKLHAQREQLSYVLAASSQQRIFHMKKDWAERLDAMRSSNREIDAMQTMLAFYREPLERPAGWKNPLSR
jgi:hypothetical protein